VPLSVLQVRVLDFNNTVLTLLCADSDVILNLIMSARQNGFPSFSGKSCDADGDGLPIETCWTLPNEILSFKS
jgi:hypothetical protein